MQEDRKSVKELAKYFTGRLTLLQLMAVLAVLGLFLAAAAHFIFG